MIVAGCRCRSSKETVGPLTKSQERRGEGAQGGGGGADEDGGVGRTVLASNLLLRNPLLQLNYFLCNVTGLLWENW